MKIERLAANVTAVGSPDIAEHAIFGQGDFGWALFGQLSAFFVEQGFPKSKCLCTDQCDSKFGIKELGI